MEAKTKSGPSPRQGKSLGLTLLLALSNDSSPSEMTDQASDLTMKKIPEALGGVPEKKSAPFVTAAPKWDRCCGLQSWRPRM